MSRKIEVDTKTFVRFWLVILGFIIAGIFIKQAFSGLIIVGAAIFLAIAIRPLVNKINKLISPKKESKAASVLAYLFIVVCVAAMITIIGPVVVNETSHFISQAPEMFQKTIGGWDGINSFGNSIGIQNLQGQIYDAVNNFSQTIFNNIGGFLFNGVGAITGALTNTILVLILTLLFLLEGPEIIDSFWHNFVGKRKKLSPKATVAKEVVDRMTNVISTYVSKQVLIAILDGSVVALAVFILSIFFGFSAGLAFPMGIIALVFYLIPMFGPIIGCGLISIILLISNPVAAIIYLVFYIVYAQIENNIIAPKIQGNALRLPAVLILVAIIIGMNMFGLIGAIIAIPVAGCLRVLFEEYPKIKETVSED